MTRVNSVFSPKIFITLTGVVLLAHLAVLRTSVLNAHQIEPSYAFTTRSIEPALSRLAAPQRSAAPKPTRSKSVRSKSVPSNPAKTDQPKLSVAPGDNASAVLPASTVIE